MLSLNAPGLLTFPYTRGCQQLLTICTMWKVQWLNSKPRWEVTLILPWRSFDTSSRPFVGKAEKGDRQGSILAQVTQSQCFLNNTDLKRKSWFISFRGCRRSPSKPTIRKKEVVFFFVIKQKGFDHVRPLNFSCPFVNWVK